MTIDSPANGTNVTSAKSVAIKVTATGPNLISKVEFYDNGKLAGTEDTDPFAYTWAVDAQANGTHKWTAKAFDKTTGASVTSTEVSVTVNVADATRDGRQGHRRGRDGSRPQQRRRSGRSCDLDSPVGPEPEHDHRYRQAGRPGSL